MTAEPTTHPLTIDQRRLWFLQQLDPDDTGYHLYLAHRWLGPLDLPRLRTALDGLAARHDILRTRFTVVDGQPRQVVHPPAPVPLTLRELPAGAGERELTEAVAPYVNAPFDLAAEAPLRAVLVRAGERDHALCLVLHHIAADGWSAGLLHQELLARYRGLEPPELPLQYGDYARAEEARLDADAAEQAYAHWQARLAGTALLRLPTDRPRPEHPAHPAGFTDLVLGPELTEAVDRLAREERCTPFMVLLAAYHILLGRWTGQQDFTVGTPLAGRNEVAHEALIGYFTRTAVIRADLRGEPDFRTVLRRVRAATMAALAHQDVPWNAWPPTSAPRPAGCRSPPCSSCRARPSGAARPPNSPTASNWPRWTPGSPGPRPTCCSTTGAPGPGGPAPSPTTWNCSTAPPSRPWPAATAPC